MASILIQQARAMVWQRTCSKALQPCWIRLVHTVPVAIDEANKPKSETKRRLCLTTMTSAKSRCSQGMEKNIENQHTQLLSLICLLDTPNRALTAAIYIYITLCILIYIYINPLSKQECVSLYLKSTSLALDDPLLLPRKLDCFSFRFHNHGLLG